MEDLYDDLTEREQAIEVKRLREELALEKKEKEALQKELDELKAQVQEMVKQKEALEKNIADLHATAVMEIERKDRRIAELSGGTRSDRRA